MEYFKLKDLTEDAIDKLKDIICEGGVIITPTDTVYGLIADSLNEKAIKKVYSLKKREFSNPMCIIVSNIDMIKKVTKSVSLTEEKVINKFFPGPLTIIFEKNNMISQIATAGLDTIRNKNARR